uniref:protein-tyrosine-phosphatase n=2 Tax=Macrostomum lignano TaxID=282301 RepID=A0A1I8HNA3_9PLAT
MQSRQLAFQSAYDLVKAGRPVIGPNDGFVEQLRLFEQMGCQVDKDHAGYKELVERLKEETAILENSKLPAPSPRQGDLS